MNTIFTILGIIMVLVIAVGFIGYAIITNNIIKSQEKELAEFRRELRHPEKVATKTPIPANRTDTIKFGGF